ncbi:MAG TPA: hypothetical protein DCS28_03685 [Candidatus Moranbacteria bacterium]|nr:hypothetical protein [Candidatus Moranbacteria bacterium]HAT75112.1 hypothetical protein [Candidatus Moranbacteria bacterium]
MRIHKLLIVKRQSRASSLSKPFEQAFRLTDYNSRSGKKVKRLPAILAYLSHRIFDLLSKTAQISLKNQKIPMRDIDLRKPFKKNLTSS